MEPLGGQLDQGVTMLIKDLIVELQKRNPEKHVYCMSPVDPELHDPELEEGALISQGLTEPMYLAEKEEEIPDPKTYFIMM